MTNAEATAVHALREASAALMAGQAAGQQSGAGHHMSPEVVRELGEHLVALISLLRTTGLAPVPTNSTEHTVHAALQHLLDASDLTHRAAAGDGEEHALPSEIDIPPNLTGDRSAQTPTAGPPPPAAASTPPPPHPQ